MHLTESCNARTDRLRSLFSDPMTEVYLLFYQAALQIFLNTNKFLQREDPIISVMTGQINTFLKRLFGRFVVIRAIQEAEKDITTLDYSNTSNQLPSKYMYQCANSYINNYYIIV